MALEAAGFHVIVYIDESYVHDRHCYSHGWTPTPKEQLTHVNSAFFYDGPQDERVGDLMNSKGRRLILLHAITKDGLLCRRIDPTDPSSKYDVDYCKLEMPKMQRRKIGSEWVKTQQGGIQHKGTVSNEVYFFNLNHVQLHIYVIILRGTILCDITSQSSYHIHLHICLLIGAHLFIRLFI